MNEPDSTRQIRVFISSTFRDMQAERDHLVKFTFPQLRKLCESRGVTWGEVDLRWGVTDEQAAEGKVLPICLEEIKRCRPYFIGLLGERYGWIPDAIPAEVIEREPWLKNHLHGKKSVTELEIIHGVLREEKMHGHAFFYFRDPAFIETVPSEQRANFVSEDNESAGKLQRLKELIRHAQKEEVCRLQENYPDPKALGKLVLADLTRVINENWPEGSQPDPLDREAMDHETYAQSRERVYIGRQEYFDRLDAYATGAAGNDSPSPPAAGIEGRGEVGNENKPLVILGESGSGKSALLANWVARYRQAHPDALVLQHYIGATPYSADWAAMLRRFMGEFKRRLGIQQNIPDQPDALRSAFPNWLYMANASLAHPTGEGGRRPGEGFTKIIIVLDALNQLEDRDGAPDLVWLPPVLPENVRLIVSTLPGRPLDEIQKRHWPTLKVELLSADERRKLIAEYLAQHAKSLNPALVERIAAAPPSANPLYLRVLLDELRLVRTHEELEERIGDYLKAESPYVLYEKVIARWEQDYGQDLVRQSLSLIWAARRGLSEAELLDLLGESGRPLPRAKWTPFFLAAEHSLARLSGLLGFSHDFLRRATEERLLQPIDAGLQDYWSRQTHSYRNSKPNHNDRRVLANLRLAAYFSHREMSERKNEEWPWQLFKAGDWGKLHDVLGDLSLLHHLWEAVPMDVLFYWSRLEANSSHRIRDTYRLFCEQANQSPEYTLMIAELFGQTGYAKEEMLQLEFARQHFDQSNDRRGFGRLSGLLADAYCKLGELAKATACYSDQLRISQDSGDGVGTTHALLGLAGVCRRHGDTTHMTSLLKQAEGIAESCNDRLGRLVALFCKARRFRKAGNQNMALKAYDDIESMIAATGDKRMLTSSYNDRGLLLTDQGNLQGALHLFRQAEKLGKEMSSMDGVALSLLNQAAVLGSQGEIDQALACLARQEGFSRETEQPDLLLNGLLLKARLLAGRGQWSTAEKVLRTVVVTADEGGFRPLKAESEELLRLIQTRRWNVQGERIY